MWRSTRQGEIALLARSRCHSQITSPKHVSKSKARFCGSYPRSWPRSPEPSQIYAHVLSRPDVARGARDGLGLGARSVRRRIGSNLPKEGSIVVPGIQDLLGPRTAGPLEVLAHERVKQLEVFGPHDAFQVHHLGVEAPGELLVLVQHVGHAVGHAGREVATGLAEDHCR